MFRNSIADVLACERLTEITEILAAGLMRHLARKSSPNSNHYGESSLHISPAESGDPTPESRRMQNG